MRYRYGGSDADDFEAIVRQAGDLRSLTRSTVPLLAWWRDEAERSVVPTDARGDVTACFEYPVSARCSECQGKGKDSFTDVMLVSPDCAIAFEAKYTEPQYESVDKWLRGSDDRRNRERVLRHWCHLIQKYTGHDVDPTALGGLVYQVVHRTASACAVATPGRRAKVTYLLFDEGQDRRAEYDDVLRSASTLLDPNAKIEFSVLRIPTRKGDDFAQLARELAELDGDEVAERIAVALMSSRRVYEFEAPQHRSLSR